MFFENCNNKEKKMRQYLNVLDKIMGEGVERKGRNGTTKALWAVQMRFNMEDGFPAVTTKQLAFKPVRSELLWFIEGSSNDNRLKELNGSDKTIWTANAEAEYWKPKAKFEGDLGRVYGVQWRDWKTPNGKSIDQLTKVIENIKYNPSDRRHVVTAWNPGEIDQMALPPCHMLYQFFVSEGKLSIHMMQRSCDMFLGVPFNIASYSLLLHMIAQVTNLKAHECVITLNDAHIYEDHYEQVKIQLQREPYDLPTLWLNPEVKNIGDFTMDDIELRNYKFHPKIEAPMAV